MQPTPVFLPGESHGQRSLVGYSPRSHKELDTTEQLHFLEEIKKSQYIMNNAITEMENNLDGTNSRITEAEDRISEVEDRMVEINEIEKKKELKEMRTISETSGTMLNTPTFES